MERRDCVRERHRRASAQLCLLNLRYPVITYYLITIFSFFHRHFLFKTGTGTTPLFSTATPGYTMASGSVYSPPTRPLPRNTLSRSAFKFKKSSKYCSWKCTALCAVGVSVLLAILLSYFIGKNTILELLYLSVGTLYHCFVRFIYFLTKKYIRRCVL